MIESINRVYRRVLLAIGRGRVTTANDGGPVQKLQAKFSDFETHDNLPRLAEYGLTSNPPIGSDAIVVFLGGDRSNGVVIATGHQLSRMKGLLPGEVAIFDDLGQSAYLTRAGIVIEGAGLPITVNGVTAINGNTTINGKLHVTGAVTSDTAVTAPVIKGTTDVIFGVISGVAHEHSGVQSGPSNTGGPS